MRSLLAVCLLTLSLFAASARDALVYVNNASAELSSGETINIRFTTPMYKADEEGERPPRPVDLSPSIASVFEWTSPVSGVIRFTAPPKLDTKYAITTRPNIKDTSGAPVTLDKTRLTSLRTPAARLMRHLVHPREFNAFEVDEKRRLGTSRTPVIYVAFNSTLSAQDTLPQISFFSDQKERIPAILGNPPDYLKSMASSDRAWSSAWEGDSNAPCSLFLSPASPLIPGRQWSIALPSHLSGNPQNIDVGYVHPFRIVNTRFERRPFEAPTLVVQLSHHVPLPRPNPSKQKELESALAENRISQTVYDSSLSLENITLSVNNCPSSVINPGSPNHTIEIKTPAKAGDLLRVSIPALQTPDGQTLPPTTLERYVPELVPRIILTGELVRQAPKDQRDIELLCVKVPHVRLTIHHIPTSNAAKAFEIWGKTYSRLEEPPIPDPASGSTEPPSQTLARLKGGSLKLRVDPEQLGANPIFEQIIEPNYAGNEAVIHRTPWSSILGENNTGMYLVTAEEFDPKRAIQRPLLSGVQQLVQRSDLSIQLLNSGRLSALCIANSATSGTPLPRVTCTAFDASWKRIQEVITGPEGTATVDGENVAFIQASRENEVLIFQTGREFHDGQSLRDESTAPIQSLLFTDRSIYRPGETAHAKLIVRESVPGTLRPATASRQPWDLKGPQGRTVNSGHLDLSERGSAHIDVRLPNIPGPYMLTIGEEQSRLFSSTSLSIAEFEPDAFEINVKATAQVTCPTPAIVNIEAHYLSGLPLSGANAQWKLQLTSAPFSPATAPDHSFHTNWHDWRLRKAPHQESEILENTVTLEKNGKSEITIPMPVPEAPIRRKAWLSVEITDAEQQTLATETPFTVDSSSFYLGVRHPAAWKRQPGQSIPISVIAVDHKEKSIAPPNPVEISVQQLHWKSTITKTPSGERVEYTHDLGPVHSVPVTVPLLPLENDRISVPKSHQSVDLSFLDIGEYIAVVSTSDESNRPISTRFSFAIHKVTTPTDQAISEEPDSDEDEQHFFLGDFPVKIIADKQLYAPGETAHLSLRSPVHGTATLCLGAQPIVQMRTLRVRPGLNGIELPITESLIPGNQITITIVESLPPGTPPGQSARAATTSVPLFVHPRDERLNVSIGNLPQDARPETILSPTVTVSDTSGNPVANAEVTLFAVDEGVLRLSGYTAPDPNAALYPMGFKSLHSLSSRNIIRLWDAWDVRQSFANKGYLVGGGGEDISGLRNNFEFTPLWIPDGRTNTRGELTATFKVPDNISAYRVMAVVHQAGHRFGKTETNFRVNKPLQIQPGTPQFVNRGDTVEIRCSVQNTTPSPIAIELTFDATGGAKVSTPKNIVAVLPEHSTTPFNFRTSFPELGDIELKWAAQSSDGKESDGLRIPLTVRSPVPARHQSIVTRITEKPFDLTEAIDAAMLEGHGEASVSLSRDPAIQLEGMVDSLLHYPYGCAEQTMSSMYPWILAKSFPVKHLRNESRRNAIQQGLQRLSSMLTPDGSVAYWPINSSGVRQPRGLENWLTAYVGLGLALIRQDSDPIVAQAAGEELETPIFDHLKALLSKPDTARIDDDALCLGACALAIFGKPDHAANERLLAKADQLNATDRALLAIAMHTSKTASSTTLSSLFQPVPEKDTSTPFLSQHRERATRLLGLSICGLLPEEQASLFQELVSGAEFGRHQTTQDHVWRLIAARFHLAAQDVGDKPTSLTWNFAASKNDETLTKNNPTSTHSLRWNGKNNRLKPASIKRTNDAPLFASIKVSSTPIETQAPQNQGFNLDRVILPSSEKPLKIGDLVKIKVTVDVHQPSAFVALECPLPSLLEPLQGFETRGKKDLVPTAMGSSHSETRADRILFFWDEMPPGKYTAFAYARVRASGDASIPAARIEEMYRPQRFSETAVERLVIP